MYGVFFLIIRRPPRYKRTDTLLPYTTLFRSNREAAHIAHGAEQLIEPPIQDPFSRKAEFSRAGSPLLSPRHAGKRAKPFIVGDELLPLFLVDVAEIVFLVEAKR